MSDRASRLLGWSARRPVTATFLLGVVAALAQAVWVLQHRHQGGFNGDENGFLATALRFEDHLDVARPFAVLDEAVHNYRVAPLVPLLSVPFVAVGSRSIGSAMMLQPALYLVIAVAVAATVARLGGRRASLVAGIVTLGLPGLVVSARSYHLALGVTAFLVLAVLAMLSSRRGADTRCMVLFGAALGAMLLSRTMTVAFLPAIGAGCLVHLERTRRTARNLVFSLVALLAVAAPWWITEWSSIATYLLKFGYGSGQEDLGTSAVVLRLPIRLGLAMVDIRPSLALPAVVVLVAVIAHLRGSWRAVLARHTDLLAVWLIVLLSGAALLTSFNVGSWLQLPIETLAVVAVVATGARLVEGGGAGERSSRWVPRAAKFAVAAAFANLLLISRLTPGTSVDMGGGSLSLSLFGGIETFQAIDLADGDPRFRADAPAAERRLAEREWADAANAVAAEVDALRPPGTDVMQTFTGDVRLMEASTIEIAAQLTAKGIVPWEAPNARSAVGDRTVPIAPWFHELPRVVVAVRTARRVANEGFDPQPIVDRALGAGWVVAATVPLPDGGDVLVLRHPDSLPPRPGSG